jgi:hypothetical protein
MQGTAPREGYHPGRLAVEQTYGYMVRNGRKYGVLATVNGFAFLCRDNNGAFFMTRLAPSTVPVPTILKMLYYMSYLAATAPPLPETDNYGQTLAIPAANYKHPVAAPQVTGPPPFLPTPSVNQAESHPESPTGTTSQYVLLQTERLPELSWREVISWSAFA